MRRVVSRTSSREFETGEARLKADSVSRGRRCGPRSRGFLGDLYSDAGADPRSTCLDQLTGVVESFDTARGLYSQVRSNGLAHQRYVCDRSPALGKACRGLYEIRPCALSRERGADFLVVG